jgi:hypothetical protein
MGNRTILIGAAVLVCAAAVAPGAQAQLRQIKSDNTAFGTTAAEFLLFPASARAASLGGGYAALGTDVTSLFLNPAGLSRLDRPGVTASTMNYVADTKYTSAALAYPFSGGSRAIGLSYSSFGFSDQPVYTVEDPEGALGNVYSVAETAVGFTYSQQFSDRFAFGITAKFVNDRLGEVVGRAGAVDLGTMFQATVGGRPLRAAFVISNLGTTLSHSGAALSAHVLREPPSDQQQIPQEPAAANLQTKTWGLPVLFRVALAYDVFATTAGRFSLMGDFTQPNNTEPGFNFGGEYSLSLGSSGVSVAGRASYTYQPDNSFSAPAQTTTNYAGFSSTMDGAGSDGFAAGGGLKFGKRGFGMSFDYAYRSMGLLGGTNIVTVGLNW